MNHQHFTHYFNQKSYKKLNKYLTNDYLKDILHKNNLIKISTLKSIKDSKNNKNNKKRTKLKKSNTEIFYNNNTFFKTMPIKIIKSKKNSSLL